MGSNLRVVSVCWMVLVAGSLWADQAAAQEQPSASRLVVCSTTQIADFTRNIVGDRWRVECVLAPGQDPHLYEVKPADSQLVAKADLCIENGWHLEGSDWMRTLAEGAGKPLVTCVDGVQPIELEGEEDLVRDPHAWFSPINAAVYVKNIERGVSKIDPEGAAEYRARAGLYVSQLRTLHSWVLREVNAIPPDARVLVTSHDAFNYFAKAYHFQSSAPAGWSTGDEVGGGATSQRRRDTVESIRSFGVKTIFVETSVNPKIVQEIANEAGVQVGRPLYSDSMGAPGTAGETYIGMMRENALSIVAGLKTKS